MQQKRPQAKADYNMSSLEAVTSSASGFKQEAYSPDFGLDESVKFPKDFGIWHKVAEGFFPAQFT